MAECVTDPFRLTSGKYWNSTAAALRVKNASGDAQDLQRRAWEKKKRKAAAARRRAGKKCARGRKRGFFEEYDTSRSRVITDLST